MEYVSVILISRIAVQNRIILINLYLININEIYLNLIQFIVNLNFDKSKIEN